MENAIMIAHYNEDLDWIEKIESEIIDGLFIYSKTLEDGENVVHVEKNLGQEIPCYLKYILDNYDDLPKRTLFLHGHGDSPHQDFESYLIANNVNWYFQDFFSVNRRDWYNEVTVENVTKHPQWTWIQNSWELFQDQLEKVAELHHYAGAQFVVHRDLILQYPKDWWEMLYKSVQENSEVTPYVMSRIFESMWHYIFTRDPVEPKFMKKQILNVEAIYVPE